MLSVLPTSSITINFDPPAVSSFIEFARAHYGLSISFGAVAFAVMVFQPHEFFRALWPRIVATKWPDKPSQRKRRNRRLSKPYR